MNPFFRYIAPLSLWLLAVSLGRADELISGGRTAGRTTGQPKLILVAAPGSEPAWISRARSLGSYGPLASWCPAPAPASDQPRAFESLLELAYTGHDSPVALLIPADSPALPDLEALLERAETRFHLIALPSDPDDLAMVLSLLDSYHQLLKGPRLESPLCAYPDPTFL